jgi:hypothetical protein
VQQLDRRLAQPPLGGDRDSQPLLFSAPAPAKPGPPLLDGLRRAYARCRLRRFSASA